MRRLLPLSAVIAVATAVPLLASADSADALYGRWYGNDGKIDNPCGRTGNITDPTFTLSAEGMEFYHGGCKMSAPPTATGVGTAHIFKMACSAENTEWEENVIISRLETGGLMMLYANGKLITANSCPKQ